MILITNKKEKRNMLVSDPNYHAANHFLEKLLAMEMSKANGQAGWSGSIDSRHEQDSYV